MKLSRKDDSAYIHEYLMAFRYTNRIRETKSLNSTDSMDMSSATATLSITWTSTTRQENQMIQVSGNCEMCKNRIETAAKSVAGVSLADCNIKTKIIKLALGDSRSCSLY